MQLENTLAKQARKRRQKAQINSLRNIKTYETIDKAQLRRLKTV